MKTCRRLLAVLTLAAMLLMLCPLGASAAGFATVNNPNPADRLNLRTRPSSTATSLGKYYNGLTVEVLDGPTNGWTHVRIGVLEGYMDSRYLTDGEVASAMPTVTVKNTSGTGLNLRLRQSTGSDSLGLYPNGTTVTVLGVGETWHHVTVGGQTGFMLASGLSPTLSFSSTEVTPSYAQGYTTAVVNNPNPADRLNLRTSASGSASTLGKYYSGTVVALLSAESNGWYKVQIGTATGYMDADYLAIGTAASSVQSTMPTATVQNTSGTGLHLRGGQSTNAKSLGLYKNGTQVTVMGITESWYHVMVGDQTGYMLASGMTPKLAFDLGK